MDNRMERLTGPPPQTGQKRLPDKALELMDGILKSWRQMDQLVQAEWKGVLNGEFGSLYRFSRAKEILCDHIAGYETNLGHILETLAPETGMEDGQGNIMQRLLPVLSFDQGKRLMDFHTKRANLKISVAITNRRTMTWVRERMDFSNELMDILSGNKLRKTATYLPPGKSIAYRRTHKFETLTTQTGARDHASSRDARGPAMGIGIYSVMQDGK